MASGSKTFQLSGLAPVIWDKENSRVLARFEGGLFTTSDKRTIGILEKMGYYLKDIGPKNERPSVQRVKTGQSGFAPGASVIEDEDT
jgi:hypothetical protein